MQLPLPNCESLESRTLLSARSLVLALDESRVWSDMASEDRDVTEVVGQFEGLGELLEVDSSRSLLSHDGSTLALAELQEGVDVDLAVEALERLPEVLWAAPNRSYDAPLDATEFTPNDPRFGEQDHLDQIGAERAWNVTWGDPSVVIAVTDDGFDLDHVDLRDAVWENPGEVAGDGIDNDRNGYVDDINGWDFAAGDNDPRPNIGIHGTHVAGIATASIHNGVGVAGVAGGSSLMPIRFYDPQNQSAWTSAVVAESFAYAVEMGAQIIVTSYNIDGFVDYDPVTQSFVPDPIVEAAFNMVHDSGVLHVNSAGNGRRLDPVRQVFTQTLLVANVNGDDVKRSSSNYGTGIDLAAPGTSILSTLPNGQYGRRTGTSMSAPVVAGVAALIWSEHPNWSRDQVVAQLLGTAVNIDGKNPGMAGLLGAGRVDAGNALTQQLAAPKLGTFLGMPSPGQALDEPLRTFTIDLDDRFDPNAIADPNAFRFEDAGADMIFGTSDDERIPLTINQGRPYQVGTNELVFEVGPMDRGIYRFVADASILTDPFGRRLDGNGDGVGGDSLVWEMSYLDPPANDAFAQAHRLNGTDLTIGGHNVGATSQSAEPNVFNAGGPLQSVWWSWTAPEDGTLTLDTAGSDFATMVAVFTGSSLGSLNLEAVDSGGSGRRADVDLDVEAGVTYRIAVDGRSNQTGSIALDLNFDPVPGIDPPSNDNFAQSERLTGTSLSVEGDNVGATAQPPEPNVFNAGGPLQSVWWSWTAPEDGTLTLDTAGSDFATMVAVFTGSSLGSLNLEAVDSGGSGRRADVDLDVEAGVTYRIAVDGRSNQTGSIALDLNFDPVPGIDPPSNDNFAQSERLSGRSLIVEGHNVGATAQPSEPNVFGDDGDAEQLQSVWWSWTAPEDGTLVLDTAGSDFATMLAVFTGGSLGWLTVEAVDSGGSGRRADLSVDVEAGVTYRITVDGRSNQTGSISLDLRFDPERSIDPPSNDNFTQAERLSGTNLTSTSHNVGATAQEWEPRIFHGGGPLQSVWWWWTAPSDGRLSLGTSESGIETMLGVFSGPWLGALDVLSVDSGGPGRRADASLDVEAGVTYQIAVDGRSNQTGSIVLDLNFNPGINSGPPSNDNFTQAERLSGTNLTSTSHNVGATAQEWEPRIFHGGGPLQSVWWWWTAPSDGRLSLGTSESGIETMLGVFSGPWLGALDVLSVDSGGPGRRADASLDVEAGVTYQIAVDGRSNQTGSIVLDLNFNQSDSSDGESERSGGSEFPIIPHHVDALAGRSFEGDAIHPFSESEEPFDKLMTTSRDPLIVEAIRIPMAEVVDEADESGPLSDVFLTDRLAPLEETVRILALDQAIEGVRLDLWGTRLSDPDDEGLERSAR